MLACVRPATRADLPRVHEVRHGTAENRLSDPSLVADAEVAWYLEEAIFLVSEDEAGVQGFVCANGALLGAHGAGPWPFPSDQKRRGLRRLDRGQTGAPLSEAPSTDVVLHPLKADILAPIPRARLLLNGGMASSLGLHPAARRHWHRRTIAPQTAAVDVLRT